MVRVQCQLNHEMLQTPGQSFLRFGSKKPGSRSGGSGEDSGGNTIMIRENGVSLASGDEVERSSLSNVPKLPNIDSKDEKSTARGLRRLQQHLESVQNQGNNVLS